MQRNSLEPGTVDHDSGGRRVCPALLLAEVGSARLDRAHSHRAECSANRCRLVVDNLGGSEISPWGGSTCREGSCFYVLELTILLTIIGVLRNSEKGTNQHFPWWICPKTKR